MNPLKLQGKFPKHNFVHFFHEIVGLSQKKVPSHPAVHCFCVPKAAPALGVLLKCCWGSITARGPGSGFAETLTPELGWCLRIIHPRATPGKSPL